MALRFLTASVAAALMLTLLFTLFPSKLAYELGYDSMPLQVSEIRIYEYDKNDISDHHFDKSPISRINDGMEIVVNGLVKNQNHTGEHFDYITEIIDDEGYVRYIHVRQWVAVPLGGQIGIDSETLPIIFDKAGSYTVKVFTWRNFNGIPLPLSEGAVVTVHVNNSANTPDYSSLPEMSMSIHSTAHDSGEMKSQWKGKIGSYCWGNICTDTAFIIPEQLIEIENGSVMEFQVSNNEQPDELGVIVYKGENNLADKQLTLLANGQYLVDLPSETEYILFVGASWKDGEYSAGSAVYYYKIKVT